MSQKKPFDDAFTFKEDNSVRDQFADEAYSVFLSGSVAKLTFTASRPDLGKTGPKGMPKGHKIPVARIALPAQGFAELYNKMHQLLLVMEAQGLVTRDGEKAKATIQ